MTPLEKTVQRQIVQFFRALGCEVYTLSQPRRTMQTAGLPDLWVFCPRRRHAFWWETKRGTADTRTAPQLRFAQSCIRCDVGYGTGNLEAAHAYALSYGLTRAAA